MSAKVSRMPRAKRSRPGQFMFYLDDDDRAMLDDAARIEKLNRCDIIRRALRAYYRKLKSTTEALAS